MSEPEGRPAFSYDLRALDVDAELGRLEAQARVVRALEGAWLRAQGISPGAAVLDLGCGPGLVTELLAELVPHGTVVGVDANPALLARAERRLAATGHAGVRFVEAWAHALPLADASVDFAYSRFLFQHLGDPAAVLQELRRVLRPGGRVVLVDTDDGGLVLHPEPPGLPALLAASQAAQARVGGDRTVGRKLRGMLVRAGFSPVRVEVQPLTSDAIGMAAFVDITLGFKRQIISPDLLAPSAVEGTLGAARALAADPAAFGHTLGYIACGTAPSE
jgi:SAM-dependent methyltransferase